MVRVLILAWFGFVTSVAIRLAVAEALVRKDTPDTVRRALAIQATRWGFTGSPNARDYERLADLDPPHARAALDRAVAANPGLSSAWIALGLEEEGAGHLPEAEQALLEAARVDRQYLPAWSLANFYFRRNHRCSFWRWAQRAAALSYDDVRPLLRLCDLLDPDHVLAGLGDSARLERAYLDFLIGEDRFDSAQRVALTMLQRHASAETPRLVDFTDRQIRAGHPQAALQVWNGLARAGLIRFSPIDATHLLTNGELNSAPTGEGFDWRLAAADGLAGEWRPFRLIFSFSGTEPEAFPLAMQLVPLDGRHYRLRFQYLTAGMPSPSGVRWALDSQESPPLLPSDLWREDEFPFSAKRRGLGRLVLLYRREPGTVPAGGRVEIRNLKLDTL